MMPGMPERRTHDYLRHGITSLFAAFNIADGTIISELHRRRRAIEFRKFLARIDKAVPAGLDVHLVCDNYATRNTAEIKTWLARHPRFHVHFTPTGSSWMNQVERWSGLLTDKLIRRGVHTSVQAPENDIKAWIATWNDNPRPFTWTKTADEILNSLADYLTKVGTGHRRNKQDSPVEFLTQNTSAPSGYVCPVDDSAESFVVGVVVSPDDVPADHAGLLGMTGVVGAVQGEVERALRSARPLENPLRAAGIGCLIVRPPITGGNMTRVALPAPTLHTARLRLRPFDDGDANDLFALHSNAYVLRYWDAPPWGERARRAFHHGLPADGTGRHRGAAGRGSCL